MVVIVTTMGTHISFIFRGYDPYIEGLKPSFFMVLGSKGRYLSWVFVPVVIGDEREHRLTEAQQLIALLGSN